MKQPKVDFFTPEFAVGYDERNKKLADISNCLHFLMSLILKDMPAQSRILCAGVGTGAELFTLARFLPEANFVALDPSQAMLEVCKARAENAGLVDRCEFVHGYVQDLPTAANFDAALGILVGHFVPGQDRLDFYQGMVSRLRVGGYLVNAEISFDLDSNKFPSMLKNWEAVQSLMGATPESLSGLPKQLRETLTVLPPEEVESLIKKAGIEIPVRFFQALMITAWYGRKV